MRNITILKQNMKKQRGSLIGIALLMFIITSSLFAVLGIAINSKKYVVDGMGRLGLDNFGAWCTNTTREDLDNLMDELLGIEDISDIEMTNYVSQADNSLSINGNVIHNSMFFIPYASETSKYYVYDDKMSIVDKHPYELSSGEVYVSPSLCSLYDVELGTKIIMEINTAGDVMEFEVKGYFEDPIMSSSMMGMKTVLISQDDYDYMDEHSYNNGIEDSYVMTGASFYVTKSDESKLTDTELSDSINELTSIKQYNCFSYSKDSMVGFMMILQNIFSAMLIVFIMILMIVSVIVIGHGISSGIEEDYVDMGILKATGFTTTTIRRLQYCQYIIAILMGMIPGGFASVLLVKLINSLTITTTGLIMPDSLPLLESIASVVLILLILIFVMVVKSSKIKKVYPIKAIRGGMEEIYFKGRGVLPIYKSGKHFWISLRQLVSGLKQYLSTVVIALLLTFILSLVGRIDNFIGPDGEGIMNAFGAYSYKGETYDVGVYYGDVPADEIEEVVLRYSDIKKQIEVIGTQSILINGHDSNINITDSPEAFNMLEGHTCTYDNEVVITETLADSMGLEIGDDVVLTYDDKDYNFIISGFYQCANDLGDNFGMNKAGYDRIHATRGSMFTYFFLEDSSRLDDLYDELDRIFGDRITISKNTWTGIDGIVLATDGITILMYVIVVIFAMVVCSLSGSKILFREKSDMGIFKSLGYTSKSLRLMFSIRFGIVTLVGAVLGTILGGILTDPIAGETMKSFGIAGFSSELTGIGLILPGITVIAFFMIFSYISARRIKRVSPEILISE